MDDMPKTVTLSQQPSQNTIGLTVIADRVATTAYLTPNEATYIAEELLFQVRTMRRHIKEGKHVG